MSRILDRWTKTWKSLNLADYDTIVYQQFKIGNIYIYKNNYNILNNASDEF